MKLRNLFSLTAVGLGLLVATPSPAGDDAADKHKFDNVKPDRVLRIASLAPRNSSWGKVYNVWEQDLLRATEGKLAIKMFFNGVQGNEDAMVSKLKSGQLDAAALTSVGLSYIDKNVLVLQLPGVMRTWKELDEVREIIAPKLEARLATQGFKLAGWGDVGLVRQFSYGVELHSPKDLLGKNVATWRNEPMGPKIFQAVGRRFQGLVNGVVVDPMEVLGQLRAKNINVISAPALAAEQLQWIPYLDHVTDQVAVCAVGGLIFRESALKDMPADLKQKFDDLQKAASRRQVGKIRALDGQAYDRIKQKMTVIQMTQAQRDEWESILREATTELSHGTFDRALVNEVLSIRKYKLVD
jgi:TRAP-type C4-dicarboxylate transport system substrate-binding protein